MSIIWRYASGAEIGLLAEWNYRLIRDEGHRNAMTVLELERRMAGFLESDCKAVVFESPNGYIGYALFSTSLDLVYLRQFYILPEFRRRGYGREGFSILRDRVWPQNVRLTVEVLTKNEIAVAFWRSVGYQDYCLQLEIMPHVKPA